MYGVKPETMGDAVRTFSVYLSFNLHLITHLFPVRFTGRPRSGSSVLHDSRCLAEGDESPNG